MRQRGERASALSAALLFILGGSALADAPPEGPYGEWAAEEIGGRAVAVATNVTIEIGADGQAFGSGGCNRFRTSAKVAEASIAFSPSAATRMMCQPDVSDQEVRFFQALQDARGWKWDGAELVLTDQGGSAVVRFAPLP